MFRRRICDLRFQRDPDACGHSKDWNFLTFLRIGSDFFGFGFYLVFRSLMQRCATPFDLATDCIEKMEWYKIILTCDKGFTYPGISWGDCSFNNSSISDA
jgi:hypothetical protein